MSDDTNVQAKNQQEFCPGCGYYRANNDHHRADCTGEPTE